MGKPDTLRERLKTAKNEGWDQWVRCEADERAVFEGMRFDIGAARAVEYFCFRYLKHTKGRFESKPFHLLPWQRDQLVYPLFGWMRGDGTRRFRRCFTFIAKKNGKSALASALGAYLLTSDGEQGAEVYSVAGDKKQADIILEEAAKMLETSPELMSRGIQIRRSKKLIRYRKTKSVFEALSSDVGTKEGIQPSAVLFDELHRQRTRDMWDTLRYAMAARLNPLLLVLTTAGDGADRDSICFEQYQRAKAIAAGEIFDLSFLPVVHEAVGPDDEIGIPEDDDSNVIDIRDPAVWKKANPSLGDTVTLSQFEEDLQDALDNPRQLPAFLRYRLNVWTQSVVRWIRLDRWDSADSGREWSFDELREEGRGCYAAIDLASTTDIAALGLLYPPRKDIEGNEIVTDPYVFKLRLWVPKEAVSARQKQERQSFDHWVDDGLITVCPGDTIRYGMIRDELRSINEETYVRAVAVDRWNATEMITTLGDDGFEMVPFGQGFQSMSAPMKFIETMLSEQRLDHGRHPVLRWMAKNMSIHTDGADNMRPDKKKSSDKIDGMVTLIMATGLHLVGAGSPQSVYTRRGLASF